MSLYGVMAEFASPEKLLEATEQARAAGYRRVEAYSPFPIEGLAEATGMRRNWVPAIVLAGGLAGWALYRWGRRASVPTTG